MPTRHSGLLLMIFTWLAPSIGGAAPPPLPIEVSGSEELKAWVAARVASAKAGAPELVRLPLVERSQGWGCTCPSNYIGTQSNAEEGPWIKVKKAPGVKVFEAMKREGEVAVVEGVFTGARVKEKGDGSTVYWLAELEVWRARSFRPTDNKAHLVLGAKEMKEKVEPLRDDRPWIVVVESFPRADRRLAAAAEKMKQALVAAGFPQAEVIDSRRAARLFCCYHVVAAGRYKTKLEAVGAAKQVSATKKWQGVTTRQAW